MTPGCSRDVSSSVPFRRDTRGSWYSTASQDGNCVTAQHDIDHRLDVRTPLRTDNAVAAIVLIGDEYLLQLRDNKPGIYFPAHWGCFGGAIEPHETCEQALVRELHEELAITLEPTSFRYFTRFDFDLSFSGLARLCRSFYEVKLAPSRLADLRLQEGTAMRLFAADEILTTAFPLTPYDSFALWFHINRERLRG
jgi:8-oxo-dGTP pyrophosphatase MutT (NUDIX family)